MKEGRWKTMDIKAICFFFMLDIVFNDALS